MGDELKKAVSLTVAISRGILRDLRMRRTVLFFVILSAIAMVFIGSTLLLGFLTEHPGWFLLYWGGCLWLTLLSVLMALFDILMLRRAAQTERQRLKKTIFNPEENDS